MGPRKSVKQISQYVVDVKGEPNGGNGGSGHTIGGKEASESSLRMLLLWELE